VDVCDKCSKSEDVKSGHGGPEGDLAGHGVSSTMTKVSCKAQLKRITLQELNGKRFEVTFSEDFESSGTMSVADMKSLIKENLAIPNNKQIRLVLDDFELQDERTLVESGVESGSVLNLIFVQKNWLEVLQREANSWTWDRQPNSCVELVPDDMHQKLLAGESVSVIKVALDARSRASDYSPSTVRRLLSGIEWLSKVLDEKDVEGIGRVWHARSDPKIGGGGSFGSNRQYNKHYVFELSGCAYQALWYTTAY